MFTTMLLSSATVENCENFQSKLQDMGKIPVFSKKFWELGIGIPDKIII